MIGLTQGEDYTIQGEPDYKSRSYNWKTAIGLQQVDGLTPSRYLLDAANANISGEITVDEAERRIAEYYAQNPPRSEDERHAEQADKVAAHIAQILSAQAFNLSPTELLSIHKILFDGVFPHAGKVRDCNISKSEWVLDGESVVYADFRTLRDALDYDFDRERAFDYSGSDERQTVSRIAKFISGIWQIHAFREGNTRTAAVFAVKYLRTFGYAVENDTFEKHSRYFRDALVRANYVNRAKNIRATQEYLDKFFGHLLLGEEHSLKSRDLRIARQGDEELFETQNTEDNRH